MSMDDRRVSHWVRQVARGAVYAGFLFIALLTLSLAVAEGGTTPASAEVSESSQETKPDAEPAEGPLRRRLESRLGSTPEERARLAEEQKRLSTAAKGFGTDPTAIVGFYQLAYGHNTYTNNLTIESAVAIIRLPVTPNFVFQVNMPYLWTDLNQPRGSTMNGTTDLNIRTGGRVFSTRDVTLFIGGDVFFPTASEQRLGTGKYTIGPGALLAAPMPRARSIIYLVAFDYNSVGGDPSRPDIHFTQVQSAINTIWSKNWWTLATMTWDVNWNQEQRTSMELSGQVGYRFDNHWAVFAGPSAGVMGRETLLGNDWGVQAGVRWVFQTPLFSEKLVEELPIQGR